MALSSTTWRPYTRMMIHLNPHYQWALFQDIPGGLEQATVGHINLHYYYRVIDYITVLPIHPVSVPHLLPTKASFLCHIYHICLFPFSALTLLVGRQKSIRPVKKKLDVGLVLVGKSSVLLFLTHSVVVSCRIRLLMHSQHAML